MTAILGTLGESRCSPAGGSEAERQAAFFRAFRYLQTRISLFLALPMDSLDRSALASELGAIGCAEGASGGAAAGEPAVPEEAAAR